MRPSPHSETMDEMRHKLSLTLYVRSLNTDARRLIAQLTIELARVYDAEQWVLDVVEVLDMPEKALEKNVFATPMLVRDAPDPVLKLLVNLSRVPSIITAITAETIGTNVQSIVV